MDFNSYTLSSFGNQSTKKTEVPSRAQTSTKLPKIVLRNSMGFELKTATSFQNAIYRAKTKLLEPNRRLTDLEWRLPHAPVPSRPDYSRSLDYDDFRSMKKPPKPIDPHKVEHWDMSFWDYLLPDRRIDRATVNVRTMEKYCRSTEVIPNPEFMDNFDSFKSVKQLFLSFVSSSSSLDKVVENFGTMDNRKKMIITQVLTSLLRGDFGSLEDLPANVRNDALLDLAKLAGEGKLSAEMQEKVFTELAQNLDTLPPAMRAKVTEQLIKSIENVAPELREQVIQQILGTIDNLSGEDRQQVLHDLVKKISSMPEENRHALIDKIIQNADNLAPQAKIQLLQDLLRDADTIPPAMRDNILQNLLNSLDTLPIEERQRVIAELTKNMSTLPPNIRQQLLDKLLEKSEEFPPQLRDQVYAHILQNVAEAPEELKRRLVGELLKNVDNMDPNLKKDVMREILNNLDLVDGTMHGQVLQNFIQSMDGVPEKERDAIMKKIIEKSTTLDDPELKRQLLDEILKNPSTLSASALQELVKNAGELPLELQTRLFNELLQKKDQLPPSVVEEMIRNSANVPPVVLEQMLKSIDKLAPSSLTELTKHLKVLPEEVRTKIVTDMIDSLDNLNNEQKAAVIGELLKSQGNLNAQQVETLMKNFDGLDRTTQEKVLKNLVENFDTLPTEMKQKLMDDLMNNNSGMDQQTRMNLLNQLLQNGENLSEDQKGQLYKQIAHELDNVKDPKAKQKILSEALSNLKDLPPEARAQILSNIKDLPASEQKELLKQILEKFDELPSEMKAKLVDDLLHSAAGMPADVQKQMIADLLHEMKDLSADERMKLMDKVLENPNLDPSVRAKLIEEMLRNSHDLSVEDQQILLGKMLENSDDLDPRTKAKVIEQMLKTLDDLPPEEKQKVLAQMLENSENLNPTMRTKLMDEMVKNINHMSVEEREKFLTELMNDPDKKDLVKELLNSGQVSSEMKQKMVEEMAKKHIDPSTLVNVLKNSKEIPPEILEKVLQNVENMSGRELNELAKRLDTLPPDMKKRVMREMMKNIQDLDSKTQATILQEMLRNSVDMDPKMVSDLIKNITNLTPSAIKELLVKADKLPPDALKELLKHVSDIPPGVLEELVKNAEQLSPDVIAALLASKDLPDSVREKLIKQINSNKKLKEKLKTLDPLVKGVEGVGKVVPKERPEVKKPKLNIPPLSKKLTPKIAELYNRLFGKEGASFLDTDMDLLANIDESELEGLLHDPDFLNIDPNLSADERKKIIEDIRKKHAKKKVIEIPPLSKEKLQEIDDPLDYLYKYCIIHPERMANYERIFLNTIKKQTAKFQGQNPPENTNKLITLRRNNTEGGAWTNINRGRYTRDTKQYHALDSSDEEEDPEKPNISKHRNGPNMINFEKEIRDAAFDEDVPPLKSETAQKLDKINFIISDLRKKENEVTQNLQKTIEQLHHLTANAIMDLYPEILDPEYDPKKKKQTTPQKTIGELKSYGSMYTNEQLLGRLNKSQIQIVDGQTEIKQVNGQVNWCKNKLAQLNMRIEMLIGERESLIARDQEERQQAMYKYQRVEKFRRQQSPLWNALYPTIDYEMNVEELDKALRQINGNLISLKECQYIRFILKIPGVKRINLKLFSLIAALSEKVTQIEPFVRKLINKFDYEALDIKMLKAKELFYLMADKSQKLAPKGYVPLRALCVELAAGGVERENIEYCKKKFDREGKNYVDFTDWLIYVPLFVEIHTRIISNPFLRYEDPLKPSKEETEKQTS